jgi:predicted enzyme related to lactoylglutathione lyase
MPRFAARPGSFCWIELMTTDVPAARTFYTTLFGWSVRESVMGNDQGTYFVFQKDGHDVGAMYEEHRTRSAWVSYVAVSDVDASAAHARSLGGQVHAGPFDVSDSGRMAVLSDPQGAMFAMWQARSHAGVQVRDEPNTLCWNELQARDVDAAKSFYPALFHWRMKETDEYTEWHLGEHAIGGLMESQAPPHVPSYWLTYFAVEDCETAVERTRSLGGSVLLPAMDIPNVGRFAVLRDPIGAPFAVIHLAL